MIAGEVGCAKIVCAVMTLAYDVDRLTKILPTMSNAIDMKRYPMNGNLIPMLSTFPSQIL
jgi:hypothetical protein